MQKNPKGPRKQRPEPTQRDLFTGGKAAEFAVFFNVAFTKLLRTIHYWKTGKIEFDENNLDRQYQNLLNEFISGQVTDDLSDEMYSKLRNYIWKGYLNERNSSGYALDAKDKNLIRKLIVKLRDLRNMHSHVFHDNQAVAFNADLQGFIKKLHDEAMFSFAGKHPEEVENYQKNLLEHPLFKENRITQEGRTFFLSLFLTTGEVSRLLQQRRGSKKNDELRYRIKHYIYRYYAHRDGAARKYYNLEEGLHDSLSKTELEELLNAQKFYRINTQINDVPTYMHDVDLFPLYYQNDDGEYLLCETVQDLQLFCEQNNLTPSLTFYPVYKKESEEEKSGVIRFGLPADKSQTFELKRIDFQRLILDIIRLGEEEMLRRLDYFLQERKAIVFALEQPDPENHLGMNGDTPITLLDYEKYKLRGNRRLREDFTEWLMGYENKHKKQEKWLDMLQTRLYLAPIEIRHFDLYQEADQKLRMTKRFIEHCVTFLIDFGVTPQWYWAFETFQTETKTNKETGKQKEVLRKVIEYYANHPTEGNWRLCVDSDHILVKLSADKKAHPYSIGENTLRNLMIALFDRFDKGEDKGIKNSGIQIILNRIDEELNRIKELIKTDNIFNINNLKLLDKDTLPESLLQFATTATPIDWQKKTQNRIGHIIKTLEAIQMDKTGMSRAEKNEQVMRCYQFFDWNPKFLRQNEYQQLSIFHYSLERITELEDTKRIAKQKRDDRTIRSIDRDMRYYNSILQGIEAENRGRIPDAVDEVLQKATSLDDLLNRIIETTLVILKHWSRVMQNGAPKEQASIAQKLKIKQDNAHSFEQTLPSNLPFALHPGLVLKAFYEKEIKDFSTFSMSKKVRDNANMIAPLRADNYDYTAYTALAAQWPETTTKKIIKKIRGASDRAKTHDALRWNIAGRYFEKVSPNVKMALSGSEKLPVKVGSLRQSTLHIPVTTADGRTVKVSLYFHQLDDTLFVESKEMLTKLVDYLYRRRTEEPERYADVTSDMHLTYGDIVKEMARLQNDAMTIANKIIAWENEVIEPYSDEKLIQDADGGQTKFLPFKKICALAKLNDSDTTLLSDLRNHVMHAKVPIEYTYRSIAKNETIRNLLGEITFQKDRSVWENPTTQDEKNVQ